MDWRLGLRATGWGLLLMLVAAGNRIEGLAQWPDALEWLKITASLAASFAGGAIAYLRPPNSRGGQH